MIVAIDDEGNVDHNVVCVMRNHITRISLILRISLNIQNILGMLRNHITDQNPLLYSDELTLLIFALPLVPAVTRYGRNKESCIRSLAT